MFRQKKFPRATRNNTVKKSQRLQYMTINDLFNIKKESGN